MTKDEVIARFTVACSDCDSTLASSLFDEAHTQLCRKFEVYDSSGSINLTANVREYSMSSTIKKVLNVLYKPSASEDEWTQVLPTTLESQDFYNNFRKDVDPGVPNYYYIGTSITGSGVSTNVIGFDKVCPTTTSGGYPIVTIYGQFLIALTGSASLPVALTGYEMVYVYHMAKAFTALVAPEKMMYWSNLFDGLCAQIRADLSSREYSIEGASVLPSFVTQLTKAGTW